MKKILYFLLAAVMLVSLMSICAFANDENVVFLSYGDGDNNNDGLTAKTPKKSYEKIGGSGAVGLLENGGKLVVVGKSYLGADFVFPKLRGELTITSAHDGVDYKNPEPAANPACAFKMAGGATLTIQSDIVFDDIIIFQEGKQNNTIVVPSGTSLTFTESVVCMTKVSGVYYNIVVEKGGTAILNGGIFSSVTGDGVIMMGGKATINEAGASTPEPTTPAVPTGDGSAVFLSYGDGDNNNDGLSPATPKKSYEKIGGKGAISLLESGGKLVIVGKSYLGADFNFPRLRGELTITSVHDGVDYKNAKPATNPACAFKMAGGATLTIQSDIVFDDIIIFQEGKLNNTIVVSDGATLTITESVVFMTKVPDVYYNIVVEKGGTAILNGGIYSSVTGNGNIIMGEKATIHEVVVVDPDAPSSGDIVAVFHNSNGNDENSGLTPDAPKKSLGSLSSGLVSLIPRGGTIVTVGKTYISRTFDFPPTSGPVTFTSVWDGVDYKNPEPATNPNCAFKLASNATLNISSDLIFDDIILFQENTQNTFHVTAGATLIVTDKTIFMTKPGNDYHYRVIVDEGCTAILSEEALKNFEIYGSGEIINSATGELVEVPEYVPVPEGTTQVKMTIGRASGYINGTARPLDAAPIIRESRTMLPVRFVAEAFGAEVGWDGATSTATVKTETVEIKITIGAKVAYVNGKEVALDAPAFIESSRTYMPVRFVAENLGATVGWDGATSTATLTK